MVSNNLLQLPNFVLSDTTEQTTAVRIRTWVIVITAWYRCTTLVPSRAGCRPSRRPGRRLRSPWPEPGRHQRTRLLHGTLSLSRIEFFFETCVARKKKRNCKLYLPNSTKMKNIVFSKCQNYQESSFISKKAPQ